MSEDALARVLDDARVWRAGRQARHWPTLSSGHPELDALLPGGGWPAARLTEIAVARWGCGELALLLPLLARLSSDRDGATGHWLAWLAPPFLPYAPALAAAGVEPARLLVVRTRKDDETLWAAEQALQSGACRLVLAWVRHADGHSLRRLQLGAEAHQVPVVLFRPPAALATPSPAPLRLGLDGGCLQLLKHRGGGRRSLSLAFLHGR